MRNGINGALDQCDTRRSIAEAVIGTVEDDGKIMQATTQNRKARCR